MSGIPPACIDWYPCSVEVHARVSDLGTSGVGLDKRTSRKFATHACRNHDKLGMAIWFVLKIMGPFFRQIF